MRIHAWIILILIAFMVSVEASDVFRKIPVRVAPSGHLLVEARLTGEKSLWFIFDTAAGKSILSSQLAEKLQLEKTGESITIRSFAGDQEAALYKVSYIDLGGYRMENLIMAGADMSVYSPGTFKVDGILGADVIRKAAFQIDKKHNSLGVAGFDELSTLQLPWQEVSFHKALPVLEATFEGKTERFILDTGSAGQFPNVAIFGPAVQRLNLLEGRPTTEQKVHHGSKTVSAGYLTDFSIGGLKIENVETIFGLHAFGPFAEVDVAGVVGISMLSRFVVTMDFSKNRIALVPHTTEN